MLLSDSDDRWVVIFPLISVNPMGKKNRPTGGAHGSVHITDYDAARSF
jgi:hypothetical protein